jgi:hypothetical protein
MGGSREKNFPAHRSRSRCFLGHLTEAVANVQDTAFKQESRIGYFYQKNRSRCGKFLLARALWSA